MATSAAAAQVVEFVRALALAWKNLAAYPPGHPALTGALQQAHQRLADLRGPAGEVLIGITSDGLLFGNEKISSEHAQKFGHSLYTRGVALLRLEFATAPSDLETFLRILGVGESRIQGQPIWEELVAAGVRAISLQPVDYSALQVTDDLEPVPQKQPAGSLWEEILRALMGGKRLSSAGAALSSGVSSVDELASLIQQVMEETQKQVSEAFDPDLTFGLRSHSSRIDSPDLVIRRVSNAIGAYVEGSGGLKRQLVVQQVRQLMRALPAPLRASIMRAVLRILATEEGSAALLRDFTADLEPDEVLEALRYLASTSSLSTHAMLLLQSLAPERAKTSKQPVPAQAMAEIFTLFGDEDVDRFNPPDHGALLQETAISIPTVPEGRAERLRELGDRVETVAEDVVNQQLGGALLDLLFRHGGSRSTAGVMHRADSVFRGFLAASQFEEAVEMIESLQQIALTTPGEELREQIHAWFGRIGTGEMIQTLIDTLLSAPPEKARSIHRLIQAMGSEATRNLLISLAEEENRSRRRKLFDFLTSLGNLIVPEVSRFLGDSRWFVVRNMIALLRAVNDTSSLPEIRRLAQHPDLRVRLEAIKTLLALEPAVPRALLENVINDPDPKLAETAIALVGTYAIKEAVEPLVKILQRRDRFGMRQAMRIKVIKTLGELGEAQALPQLEHLFRDSLWPWTRPERRAAFESLAGYPPAGRASMVERGLRSRDEQVREICRKLSQP